MEIIIKVIAYLVPILLLGYFLSKYIYHVYAGEKVILSKIVEPIEKSIYRILKIKETEEMGWKKYLFSIVIFSLFGFLLLFIILLLQQLLPLNPKGIKGLDIGLAFNTACSFITNTNWQSYVGENSISYFTQMIGLTVQNFLSAGIGMAVLFALIRGITNRESKNLGNFWKDITRSIVYVLIPLSIIVSILLVSGGVVQTFTKQQTISTLESKTEQIIPLGPAASQIAIKQLGTNGGGFFGQNSAYPLENPNAFTNYIECSCILLIPIALVFMFGHAVKDKKQGYSILIIMLVVLIISTITVCVLENNNYEGKETRFGTINSGIWSVFTTSASNGSVNSMHESYHPLSTTIQMLLMGMGEIIFGGIGSGLYTMIAFILIAVFIAGLMVGRTPEYLGKKIEPFDMKMAMLIILTSPICTLITVMIICLIPNITQNLGNTGAHGFSEILYAAISTGANNGSAFAGFQSNTLFINIVLGVNMAIVRYLPMYGALRLAENLSSKRKIPTTAGTLQTATPLFIILLLLVIIIIAALSFFPALVLGPIAEFLP